MSEAVAIRSWTISGPVSRDGMYPRSTAVRFQDCSNPRMPPSVPVDADVEVVPDTETMCRVPQDVCPERWRNVRVVSSPGTQNWEPGKQLGIGSPPSFSFTTPLPASACGQYMPPWWSVESKSFDASATRTSWRQRYSSACRMKVE